MLCCWKEWSVASCHSVEERRCELERQLRDGGIHWKFSLARQWAGPEPGWESTFLQIQRAERHYFKALLWPLQNPLWKLTGTLPCLLYSVFITADQETPGTNSSQGMFPLLPGGRAEQPYTLPESRREYYVNHKAPFKLKKPSAAAFRGRKQLRAREITWSPISRYGLRDSRLTWQSCCCCYLG